MVVNFLTGSNFMFLMYAEPGNPLYFFEQLWGNHLLGLPILVAAVIVLMHVPRVVLREFLSRRKSVY